MSSNTSYKRQEFFEKNINYKQTKKKWNNHYVFGGYV